MTQAKWDKLVTLAMTLGFTGGDPRKLDRAWRRATQVKQPKSRRLRR